MIIKTTELLKLLSYATEVSLSYNVKKDDDGSYSIKFYELYANRVNETIYITDEGENDWYNDGVDFEYLLNIFVDMLKEQEEEKLKEQKRQEVLNKLTTEEKELLGVK